MNCALGWILGDSICVFVSTRRKWNGRFPRYEAATRQLLPSYLLGMERKAQR